jgi:hypothetical protein
MHQDNDRPAQHDATEQPPAVSSPPGKQPWQEPKLAFVEPKLTHHGKLEEVTAAFFQQFTPR